MLHRLRRVPIPAYLFLAISLVGAIAEVSYHLLPLEAIPAYQQWLASLSAVDREFLALASELVAHLFVAVGLMGMVAVLLYEQMKK